MNTALHHLENASADLRLSAGIEVSNLVLRLLDAENLVTADQVIDQRILELPNAERQDGWFAPHPWMEGEHASFELLDSGTIPLQAKFYWLKKRSSAFLAGAVHFTPNWEDHDYTRTNPYKVGIDFFLKPDASGLTVALSNRGKLRVLEFSGRVTNTQIEIFKQWGGAIQPAGAEGLHAQLWDSFKLQPVNAKFYLGVSDAFNELTAALTDGGRPAEASKLFASRLLGRLIFVWFLRKMRFIDETIGYFTINSAESEDHYRTQLERLFFRTLNTPKVDRQAESGKSDESTPYLNGGLFTPRLGDWVNEPISFPKDFFVRLFDHFDSFNFTTDESTPEYEQVAIDPEMLGRVFESLLATQLEDTGEQARKAKGAFYTPREIVATICKESLREALRARLDGGDPATGAISKLLDTSDRDWAINGTNSIRDIPQALRSQLVRELLNLRILDPACGSGAFPMGMLQLMFRSIIRLDPRQKPYQLKLALLKNNVFGVDIEPMAVEISRLRSWLSLIVEESISNEVEPLPNLDFSFVCANSLVSLEQAGLFGDDMLVSKLQKLRADYFEANIAQKKNEIQKAYGKLIHPDLLDGFDGRGAQLKSFDPFNPENTASFFDSEYMFGVVGGFDIVVGNPPYVDSENMMRNAPLMREYLRTHFQSTRGNWDLFVPFIERSLELTSGHGVVSMIVKNSLMGAPYATAIRAELVSQGLLGVWDFGGVSLFESASVDTCVFLASKTSKNRQIDFYSMQSSDSPRFGNVYQRTELESVDSWVPLCASPQIRALLVSLSNLPNLLSRGFMSSASATVGEAYKISEIVQEAGKGEEVGLRLINTGSIDPFVTHWGKQPTRYLGSVYERPIVHKLQLGLISRRRLEQAELKKIVVIGMGNVEAYLDAEGKYLAGKTTSIIWNNNDDDTRALTIALGLLNSKVAKFWFKNMYLNAGMAGIRPADLLTLPIPALSEASEDELIMLTKNCIKAPETLAISKLNELVAELYQLSADERAIVG